MMTARKLTGSALATAAAGLFVLSPVTADAFSKSPAAMVNCYGVNSCKGQGACKTANNACKGQNSCKGMGFVQISEDECTAKGGSTEPK